MKQVDDLETIADPALAATERTEPAMSQTFALKHEDTFMVADAYGDVYGNKDGLFRDDTRVLSHFRLTFGPRAPSLLSASMGRDNVVFTAHMTNHPLPELGGAVAPEGVIHVERSRFLWRTRLFERISCHNFGNAAVTMPLTVSFRADFCDMFEVRGSTRERRGELSAPAVRDSSVRLAYWGLDGLERTSTVSFSEAPERLGPDRADYLVKLPSGGAFTLYVEVGPDSAQDEAPDARRYRRARAQARLAMRAHRLNGASLHSATPLFTQWLDQSRADLALLTSDLATGPYPYAGIPWFSTPFGRDGIVTALETLWLDPSIARGVLRFLASRQATATSTFQDSAPGKIMHETRKGEMCALKELPFALYYGGVDSTPMFVVLAGAYVARTGDTNLIDELWPALERAMGWIEGVIDKSPNKVLDYARGEKTGLSNQGWKDSEDSVFHADGSFPTGPIALVEVQGYAYRAFLTMSDLAARRGNEWQSDAWATRARALAEVVESRFWMEDKGFYGIALDGQGKLCAVEASNAGHLLFAGLPTRERAARVVDRLGENSFRSGWGIRTLAQTQPRFNPMSYHNGSVWPHDTALCALGMRRYGDLNGPLQILEEMFDAAFTFGMRLPELFCGFPRRPGLPPIGYPVACLPQAWSAGSALLLLQSCLGITIDGWTQSVTIDHPRLPAGVQNLTVRRLAFGPYKVDLTFERYEGGIATRVEGTAEAVSRVHGDWIRRVSD
ncbi:Amylo-alpha-1,6-glucosidase [Pararobbsia alpina]|uniref:amylo-alpha-1,6-glucosidase n=1 Tax=Pararobbsia alpina TaxID=621374 RepID=UPI0039A57798